MTKEEAKQIIEEKDISTEQKKELFLKALQVITTDAFTQK